ncbi:hypothetical protein QQG55_34710 [Brugia pahangi]
MHSERRSKRPSTRPALQIYRPPGLRGNDENSANTKPNQTAGAKQLKKETVKKQSEENNNYNTMESGKCANTLNGCTRKSTDNNNFLNDIAITGGAQTVISLQRSDSALSGESIASSQASTKSPNSTSSRHLHLSENSPPNHHHHQHHQQQQQQQLQYHYNHHHHHHRQQQQQQHHQSEGATIKQHLKKSSGSGSGSNNNNNNDDNNNSNDNNSDNNNNGTTNSSSSLLRMDESAGVIGISGISGGDMKHGMTIATEGGEGGGGREGGGGGGGGGGGNPDNGFNNISSRKSIIICKEQQQQQQNANKKKQLNGKEIEELAIGLRKLNLTKENTLVEQFITSNFEDGEIGGAVGQMLVHFSIEENRQAGKAVARIAAQLLNFDTANVFHQGITVALMHYFECRDRLRIDHFRVWITFLNFVSDLYASVGYIYEGELVDLVFHIFGYLLKAPILDTLKIEELESLIGCLLSVGYDLERQCPEQLAILKDLIRDAFIEVQEPWARKMILLLMELGASGWKLPPEANEYYFQHTSS